MIELQDRVLVVKGKIDFNNANQVYLSGQKLIQQVKEYPLLVDLSGLEHGSTLALAVLVQWLRLTPEMKGLQLTHVPNKMMKIIESCHLEKDLSIKKAS